MTTTNTSISVAESAPRHAPDEVGMAAALDAQWSRAQAGLVEIIRFGAMLAQVARQLDNFQLEIIKLNAGHGGDRRGGTGLKAWLAEHCPGINYNTGYGYMVAANGLAREARLAADVPLLSLMGEDPIPEARAEKLRARVFSILEGASLSLLKAAATATPPVARGGARPGAGRPTKTLADPDVQLEEALRCALRLTDMVRSWAIDEDGLGTLPDGPLETFLANMSDVCKRGREILSGRAAASKRRI